MRAHRYNKLYRFMFCNTNDVVFDVTIPSTEIHDPSLFLKYFCNALSSQSVCYGQQDSIFEALADKLENYTKIVEDENED